MKQEALKGCTCRNQNKNRHLVFRIFKKNKKTTASRTTESVIFRLYSKDIIVKPIATTPSFSCFFVNIRNTRCLFSQFVLFCTFKIARVTNLRTRGNKCVQKLSTSWFFTAWLFLVCRKMFATSVNNL